MENERNKNKQDSIEKFNLDPELAIFDELQDINDNVDELAETLDKVDFDKLKAIKGEKGDKGERGEKGDKGKDGLNGKDGKDGRNGYDGRDGLDGDNGKNGKDGVDGKDGKDGSPDTPKDIVKKLESLNNEQRLDVSAIKNLEPLLTRINQTQSKESRGGYSGSANPFDILSSGSLVGKNIKSINFTGSGVSSVTNNNGDIVASFSSAGGGSWGSITGTLSSQTDLQTALNAKQNTITTGTTLQYFKGDFSLGTFPTALSSFTNDLGNYGGFLTDAPSDGSTYGRKNGLWATIAGGGDMVLASAQTNSGVKTFLDGTMGLRNVANTFTSVFQNANTAARTYTLKDASGTIAFTTDITGTNSGTNTGDQTSIVGITGTKAQFNTAVTDGDIIYLDSIDTITGAKTFSTAPVFNALPTGTAVANAATASTLVSRDANGNTSVVNLIEGYTTTATAGGTTTLTIASTYQQYFTGTLAQAVTMPASVPVGQAWIITNNSTGAVTVNATAGANTIVILAGGTIGIFTSIANTATPTAASWGLWYEGDVIASGKKLTTNNTLTLAGTDNTTMTFPTTSATLARTDAANTFLGQNTMAAGTVSVTPILLQSGTDLTSATAGAYEFDGKNLKFTPDTSHGKAVVSTEQKFRLTATGTTISTIANYFGTTSNITLVSGGEYEIEIDCWFLKTTAGTVTWTFTNSAAPTGMNIHYELSPITGIVSTAAATTLIGDQYNITAAAPTVVSGSLTTAVNHRHKFFIRLINGTGTSLKIQATCSAGTITPGINSSWTCRRIPAANVGTFAA